MKILKTDKILIIIGILFIILSVFANEKILAHILSPDGSIDNMLFRVIIVILELLIAGWGIFTIVSRKNESVLRANLTLFAALLIIIALILAEKAMHIFIYANNHINLAGEMVCRIPTTEKVVALTYDDGPSEAHTTKLIEILGKHDIKATFFLIGKRIAENPDLAKELLNEGHQLANHSYTHQKMIYRSPDDIRSEIEQTNSLLREIGVDYEIHFRAPYGKKFIVLPLVLSKMGMKHIVFDVEPQDWRGGPSEDVVRHVLEHAQPGSIILLHDGYEKSGKHVTETTEQIILGLKAEGYRFLTTLEMLALNEKVIKNE